MEKIKINRRIVQHKNCNKKKTYVQQQLNIIRLKTIGSH